MHGNFDNGEDDEVDEFHRAYKYVMGLLNRRLYSEHEVESRLKHRGITEPVITALVEFLIEEKLLDDYRFARAWVNDRNVFVV